MPYRRSVNSNLCVCRKRATISSCHGQFVITRHCAIYLNPAWLSHERPPLVAFVTSSAIGLQRQENARLVGGPPTQFPLARCTRPSRRVGESAGPRLRGSARASTSGEYVDASSVERGPAVVSWTRHHTTRRSFEPPATKPSALEPILSACTPRRRGAHFGSEAGPSARGGAASTSLAEFSTW